MLTIDQEALRVVEPELRPAERVLWAGRPCIRPIFHRNENEVLLPFGLIFGVSSLLYEVVAVRVMFSSPTQIHGYVMAWFGLGSLVMGQYLMWGRFLYAARKKKRTYYAVTDRRVLVVQTAADRQVASAELKALPHLHKLKRSGDIGTIRFFSPPEPFATSWREMAGMTMEADGRLDVWDPLSIKRGPVFADLKDTDSVYQLISALRDQALEAQVARLLQNRERS